MSIPNIVAKLRKYSKSLESSQGPITFLGLFLREDAAGYWDVVVAASWLRHDSYEHHDFFTSGLQKHLTNNDFTHLSRIVILDYKGEALLALIKMFHGHAPCTAGDFETVGGAQIQFAYIEIASDIESLEPKIVHGIAPNTAPGLHYDGGNTGQTTDEQVIVFRSTQTSHKFASAAPPILTEAIHPTTTATSITLEQPITDTATLDAAVQQSVVVKVRP
jgi:hypothetical protein